MTYFAYLDEFGHVGQYNGRSDPKYHHSPVFGLAGFVLPADEVRAFGTWFYQRKCELLDYEIAKSGKHPATWEMKGASLYSAKNVGRYRGLRSFTNRLFNKIKNCGGFVFYVGVYKTPQSGVHNSNRLYENVFKEAIKRIDRFCAEDCNPTARFVLILDEHQHRAKLIEVATRRMYAKYRGQRNLIEPPFHLESHLYQTVQAADWIAGVVGRLGAIWAEPKAWQENEVFRQYFEQRLNQVCHRSGIRNEK